MKIDIEKGQQFGKLTVLCEAPDKIEKSGTRRKAWHCRCECGNEIDVIGKNLLSGNSKSCGCGKHGKTRKINIGERFGQLEVIEELEPINGEDDVMIRCRCDCGKEITLKRRLLLYHTRSCGCLAEKRESQIDDLTGQKFGKLTVQYRANKKVFQSGSATMWHCKCDCGNECDAYANSLKKGSTVSCGCAKVKDLVGKRFGKLVVLSRTVDEYTTTGIKKIMWHCKCDCGNECDASSRGLLSGDKQSCGCGKKEDLTGQKFGRLLVVAEAESRVSRTGHRTRMWLCRCDCGNETTVSNSNLRSGVTQSCGCLRSELNINRQKEILAGQRFGRLVVQYECEGIAEGTSKRKRVAWHCKCDCGNEIDVKAYMLKKGLTSSCGCLQKELARERFFEDLTGQKFGRWTVLYQADYAFSLNGYKRTMWHCRCECGNEADVGAGALKQGTTKSCGCLQHDLAFDDLTGKRFGRWTVLSQAEPEISESGTVSSIWNCKCDCGTEKKVRGTHLRSGASQSCGCWIESTGEYYTKEYLKRNDIEYNTQVKFEGLEGIGGKPLSFDFSVVNEKYGFILIEYQGIQHYKSVGVFGGENQLVKQKTHDDIKRKKAKELGYPLIEIPYTKNTDEKISKYLDKNLLPYFE